MPVRGSKVYISLVIVHKQSGRKPMIDVISFMGRKNLFLRRRRVRNRFCATISLVRNLSNHFTLPMLNLNSFLGMVRAESSAIFEKVLF